MNLDNRSCFFDRGLISLCCVACLLLPKLLMESVGTVHLQYRHSGHFHSGKFA